ARGRWHRNTDRGSGFLARDQEPRQRRVQRGQSRRVTELIHYQRTQQQTSRSLGQRRVRSAVGNADGDEQRLRAGGDNAPLRSWPHFQLISFLPRRAIEKLLHNLSEALSPDGTFQLCSSQQTLSSHAFGQRHCQTMNTLK